MLRAAFKLHLHTILTLLLVLQTILGQCQRAGMLCVRQLRCIHVLGDCFGHASSQPTLFSETVSMVSVDTSRAECALDHDRSPSEPIWTSRNRLSFDRPIASVSLVCQLLSSLLHFFWIVKDCQDFRLPGIVIPMFRFHTGLVAEESVHRVSTDTNPLSPLA